MPASTSPEPAVASCGGALSLIAARPSGAAITVSLPFSSTTAPLARAARRARSSLLSDAPAARPNRRANSPSCGVITQSRLDRGEQRPRIVGEYGQRIGIEHGPLSRRQRRQRHVARLAANARARSDQHRVAPRIGQQCSKSVDIGNGLHDHRGQRRRRRSETPARAPRPSPGRRRPAPRRAPPAAPRRSSPRPRPPAHARGYICGSRGRATGTAPTTNPGDWPRPAAPMCRVRWPGCRSARARVHRTDPAPAAADARACGEKTSRSRTRAARCRAPRRWRRRPRSARRPRPPAHFGSSASMTSRGDALDRTRQPGAEYCVDNQSGAARGSRRRAARPAPSQRSAAIAASPRSACRSPSSATRTGQPRSARIRAATNPSPPLLPGRTGPATGRRGQRRETASATARPAFSISAMPDTPPAIVSRSASPISAGDNSACRCHASLRISVGGTIPSRAKWGAMRPGKGSRQPDGANLTLPPSIRYLTARTAGVAQWLERQIVDLDVVGSNPITRPKCFGTWRRS